MEDYTLSDSELFVMKVIWRSEESLSLQDIAERVNRIYGKNWKPQTVSVFLGRIVRKIFWSANVREDSFTIIRQFQKKSIAKKKL